MYVYVNIIIFLSIPTINILLTNSMFTEPFIASGKRKPKALVT